MLAVKEDRALARPLLVLVPMIKEELEAGDQAGMAHYRTAGVLLIEAKAQVKHGEWKNWVSRNFKLSINTAQIYMKLAEEEKHSALGFSSLSDFVRKTSNPEYNKPHTVRPQPWHEPVKQAAETVNVERMKQAMQARTAEAKLVRELGLKLIDIGYKVLATKLHPDKGGSAESMARLNRVRDQLKKSV